MIDSMRINVRERRAEMLVHATMHALREHISRSNERAVLRELRALFTYEGVEVITDQDRKEVGLPPRGHDGWTADELWHLERQRLARLYQPMPIIAIGENGK